ncbi:MAG TPA: hypothetical protein VGS28_04385, partial [Candidatus Saccharimonadales bacterium]|nr:hypothetical protein [Candidatus Saccharimonadales bacterium]
ITSAVHLRKRKPILAKSFFIAFVAVSVLVSAFMAGNGDFLLNASPTGGPTERQALLQVWACGQQLNFQAPSTPQYASIGTATYHLYSGNLLEYKGTPLTAQDMSLSAFFSGIGGNLNTDDLSLPLSNSYMPDATTSAGGILNDFLVIGNGTTGVSGNFASGRTCQTGGKPAVVQLFADQYSPSVGVYVQHKVGSPGSYVLSDYARVPNGDCLIVVYGPNEATTSHFCSTLDTNPTISSPPSTGGSRAR